MIFRRRALDNARPRGQDARMNAPRFLHIDREEYEHLAKALVVYDHVCHRNRDRRRGGSDEVTDLQDRWLGEPERFGVSLTEEERDALVEAAYKEIDEFADGETWHELAWWLAERECARLGGSGVAKEARDLITDRLYHEIMDEFTRHGIDRLTLPIPGKDQLAPRRVADALKALRSQTKGIGTS